jgi:hypothetical protein
MTRQETLEQIQQQLETLDDEALESVLQVVIRMQPLDALGKPTLAEHKAVKLDAVIEELKEDLHDK